MYKNKKLKSILAFTTLFCALGGIAFSSIITTSCSKKSKDLNIDVDEYLNIVTEGDVVILNGPKKEIPQDGTFDTLCIPNYVTNIAENAFRNNKTGNAITKLTLQSKRKKPLVFDGPYSFYECGFKSADFSNLATGFIGARAFYKCFSLTTINLSNITGSIGELAFDGCPLQNVIINNASPYTWANNVGPAKILIKKDGHADSKFKWATDKQIGSVAYGNLQFPTNTSITTLADSFLEDCGGIKGNIIFPSTLSTIPTWCISKSLITSIDLPASVGSFGECAFAYNNSLKDVYIRNTTGVPYNTANSGCFKECPLLSNGEGKFHVPSTLIDSYYNNEANGWTGKGFTFIAI